MVNSGVSKDGICIREERLFGDKPGFLMGLGSTQTLDQEERACPTHYI